MAISDGDRQGNVGVQLREDRINANGEGEITRFLRFKKALNINGDAEALRQAALNYMDMQEAGQLPHGATGKKSATGKKTRATTNQKVKAAPGKSRGRSARV